MLSSTSLKKDSPRLREQTGRRHGWDKHPVPSPVYNEVTPHTIVFWYCCSRLSGKTWRGPVVSFHEAALLSVSHCRGTQLASFFDQRGYWWCRATV